MADSQLLEEVRALRAAVDKLGGQLKTHDEKLVRQVREMISAIEGRRQQDSVTGGALIDAVRDMRVKLNAMASVQEKFFK